MECGAVQAGRAPGGREAAARARIARRSGGAGRSKEHEGNERHRERWKMRNARGGRWKRGRGDGWRSGRFRVSLRVRSGRGPSRCGAAGVAVAAVSCAESCGDQALQQRGGCGWDWEVSRSGLGQISQVAPGLPLLWLADPRDETFPGAALLRKPHLFQRARGVLGPLCGS